MEFATTQSFVKALEGVANSGVLEDPVLSDVRQMISMSYDNGTIDEALEYKSKLYPFYIVKNNALNIYFFIQCFKSQCHCCSASY